MDSGNSTYRPCPREQGLFPHNNLRLNPIYLIRQELHCSNSYANDTRCTERGFRTVHSSTRSEK